MGYFCRRFSCQAVLLSCSFLGAVSLGACYLTTDIILLTFLFGFVQGVASSGIFVGINVLVSQHFERLRATACSVIFFFSGLNMLLAPPLAELFRSTYGIRDTFLLLGALTLNACPAAIVLRSPDWMKDQDHPSGNEENRMLNDVASVKGKDTLEWDDPNVETYHENAEPAVEKLISAQTAESPFVQPQPKRAGPVRLLNLWSKLFGPKGESQRNMARIVRQFLSLSFAVNALTCIVILFGMATFLLLSVDIAKDRGVPPSTAVFLTTAFAIGDLVLRAVCGLVIDAGFLSLESMMFLGALLQAIAFELFVWLRTFPLMLVSAALIGASNGSRISLQAPALVKDFGIESLPLLIGGVYFVNGLALLSRPSLVGYCRDSLGSYDMLLHLVAISSAVLFVAWLVKYFIRSREQA
ncbi:monocarboxylate transporter 3-like isoform X2 [Amblyomma americanum]